MGVILCVVVSFLGSSLHAFEIDLSRRQKQLPKTLPSKTVVDESTPTTDSPQTSSEEVPQTSIPAPVSSPESKAGFFANLFEPAQVRQEIVILNTETGFVPRSVTVKKGNAYTIHVVNVNEKQKNVSFILEAFSEYHSTFFGKMKSFDLNPKQEGIYTFQSPETSLEGRIVVIGEGPMRSLSSQDSGK